MTRENKNVAIVIRMTESERAEIKRMARACGEWSSSEFIRGLIEEKRQALKERKEVENNG